jgi:hypothetical protein
MTADVTALKPKESPTTQIPILRYSLTFDLGAGRVCAMETYSPSDGSLRDLNLMLDKMTAAGDRQRAHYKIEELERELDGLEKEQAQHAEDLARIDREYEAAQAKRQEQAEAGTKALSGIEEAAANDPRKRGPVIELKGAVKANYGRVKDGVEKLKAEMEKAKEERTVAHGNSKTVMDRRAALIAKAKDEIARCREIVAAGLK